MKAALILFFFIQVVLGCATKPIVLPDGSAGYSVECKNSLAICYQRASKICPKGYDFIDTDKTGSSSAAWSGASGSAHSKVIITRIVKCKTGAESIAVQAEHEKRVDGKAGELHLIDAQSGNEVNLIPAR